MNNNFNGATTVGKTRAAMNGFMGEIIADVIGETRVKELFDAAGKHPDEYKDKPTGQIALELGVITPETKNALLVAQAAERTLLAAAKARNLATEHKNLVESGAKIDSKTLGIIEYGSEAYEKTFKFVGSPRDPDILKAAQSTNQAAQLYLGHEARAIKEHYHTDAPLSVGPKFADGLEQAAKRYYQTAADMLAKEGHTQAAERIANVAKSLRNTAKDAPVPSSLMDQIIVNERASNDWGNKAAMEQGYPGFSLNENYVGELKKVRDLTKLGQPATKAAAPTTKQKKELGR